MPVLSRKVTMPAPTQAPRRRANFSPAGIRDAIRADARRDGVPTWFAEFVAWTPIVGSVVLLLIYLVDRDTYYVVLREDWPVEWAQFTLLAFVSVLAVVTAWRLRRRGMLVVGALLLLGVGTFVLAGEEISWAQRAFAFGTPAGLEAVNEQSEFNFHNVMAGGLPLESIFKLFSFVLAVAGLTLALATRGPKARLRGLFWDTLALPLYTIVGSLTMIGYWIAVVAVQISPVVRYQEWAEFSLYLALAGYLYAVSARAMGVTASGLVTDGRPARDRIDRPALICLAVVVLITVVLASLSAYHGIIPLNNPEAIPR